MAEQQKRAGEYLLKRSPLDRKLAQRFGTMLKKAGKQLLPKSAISEIRQFRACNGKEQVVYLRMRLWSSLNFLNSKPPQPSENARSFLFVCFGNIARSPMCEALMNRALATLPMAGFAISSAGLNADPGRAAHPYAIAAAEEFGLSLKDHKARLLTAEMVAHANAIFTMDYQNQAQLIARYPEAAGKVRLLGAYSGSSARSLQIRDPYYDGEQATRECYRTLETCIQNLVRCVLSPTANP